MRSNFQSMKHSTLFALLGLTLLSACELEVPETVVIQPDLIFPVVKTTINLDDIEDLTSFKGSIQLDLFDIAPIPQSWRNDNQLHSIPAITNENFETTVDNINDIIQSIDIENANTSFTIVNNFPIGLSSGATIKIFDTNNPTIGFNHTIPIDIAPNETYKFDEDFNIEAITGDLGLQVANVNTTNIQNVRISDLNSFIDVSYEVKINEIKEVIISENISYTFTTDTSDFDVFDDLDNLDLIGDLHLFYKNNTPFAPFIKVTLLDDANAPTLVLFDGALTPSPFNSNGESTTPFQDQITILSVDESITSLLLQSKKVIVETSIETPSNPNGNFFVLNSDSFIDLKITARTLFKTEL